MDPATHSDEAPPQLQKANVSYRKQEGTKTGLFLLPARGALSLPEARLALLFSREEGKGAGFEAWRTTWTK
jgi:hypothetical protein